MRIVVTGGAGFIGSHLVRALIADRHSVVVLDNLSTGCLNNLKDVIDHVEFRQLDLTEPIETIVPLLRGADCLFHLAAATSVPGSIETPLATHRDTATATLNLLQATVDAGVKKVIYSSSCAVYGDQRVVPWKTTMLPQPLSPYGAGKLSGEQYCGVYQRVHGLNAICLRYFNVFGPGQNVTSGYAAVIPSWLAAIRRGLPLKIWGDGTQSRDFVHVRDVVQANLLALDCKREFAVLNIGSGKATSLLQLLNALRSFTPAAVAQYGPARQGDILHCFADMSETHEVLGFEPVVDLGEGLAELIEGQSTAAPE